MWEELHRKPILSGVTRCSCDQQGRDRKVPSLGGSRGRFLVIGADRPGERWSHWPRPEKCDRQDVDGSLQDIRLVKDSPWGKARLLVARRAPEHAQHLEGDPVVGRGRESASIEVSQVDQKAPVNEDVLIELLSA